MGNVIQGDIVGAEEFLKVLNTLGDEKVVNTLLKKTNKEVVKPLQKELKGTPYPSSLTRKMAIRAVKIDGNRHPNAISVGPLNSAFPLRWLDQGTKERYTKSGAYRGMIQGKSIIESLIDNQAKSIQKNATQQYGEGLVKITAKDVKRINKKR